MACKPSRTLTTLTYNPDIEEILFLGGCNDSFSVERERIQQPLTRKRISMSGVRADVRVLWNLQLKGSLRNSPMTVARGGCLLSLS